MKIKAKTDLRHPPLPKRTGIARVSAEDWGSGGRDYHP